MLRFFVDRQREPYLFRPLRFLLHRFRSTLQLCLKPMLAVFGFVHHSDQLAGGHLLIFRDNLHLTGEDIRVYIGNPIDLSKCLLDRVAAILSTKPVDR